MWTTQAKHVVISGDSHQLGPCIQNPTSAKAGLATSLLQHFIDFDHKPISLNQQYRCHPLLFEFSNQYFYDGLISTSSYPSEINLDLNKPLLFIDCPSVETQYPGSTSFHNPMEVDIIVDRLALLTTQYNICATKIGIVTPYSDQAICLTHAIAPSFPSITIRTIDAYQGSEKDVIIASLVRSDKRSSGFINDNQRLNVMLTRAKSALIIVGNASTWRDSPSLLSDYINYVESNNCLLFCEPTFHYDTTQTSNTNDIEQYPILSNSKPSRQKSYSTSAKQKSYTQMSASDNQFHKPLYTEVVQGRPTPSRSYRPTYPFGLNNFTTLIVLLLLFPLTFAVNHSASTNHSFQLCGRSRSGFPILLPREVLCYPPTRQPSHKMDIDLYLPRDTPLSFSAYLCYEYTHVVQTFQSFFRSTCCH